MFSMIELTLKKRIGLLLAAAAIQMLYGPTSQWMTGGLAPKIALDALIPIWPVWVVAYAACYPFWLTVFVYSIWKMDSRLYRALMAACLFTFSLGILTFVLFPTYVDLPMLAGTDAFSALLRQIQIAGGRYDALPSGHIYITTLLALFHTNWHPRQRWFWSAVVVTVSLSTLFTGQHYILDVVAGLAVAWIGYRFGLWWVDRKNRASLILQT
jgi:membrane-associated phospholipid phosphatase